MSAFEVLYGDIKDHGVALPDDDWRNLRASFEAVTLAAGDVILCQSQIADSWMFVAQGVAASAQTMIDGEAWIARFFEAGHFAANLPSVWRRDYFEDDLVAVTPVAGVLIPDAVLREAYLRGGSFGVYLRIKADGDFAFRQRADLRKDVREP